METATPDIAPLELVRTGHHLRFCFAPQPDILGELPRDFEQLVATRLGALLAEPGPLTTEIDLQDLPGLSSRQIGALIALQKVLRPRFGRPRIVGASQNVRHVLALTHVDTLFELG